MTPLGPLWEFLLFLFIINNFHFILKFISFGKIFGWKTFERTTTAGKRGEKIVKNHIKSIARKGDVLLENFYTNELGGGEVDFILISGKQALVFEVKNIKGKVSGNIDDSHWNFGNKKYYNPIQQNKNHIKKIKPLFEKKGFEVEEYFNIVYLPNKSSKDINVSLKGKTNCFVFNKKRSLKTFWKTKKKENYNLSSMKRVLKTYTKENKKNKKRYLKKIKKQYN